MDGPAGAARCEALAGLELADTIIESAAVVPAKPASTSALATDPGYREFCRVIARVRAAPDSDVGVEVWLPTDNWQGVFHGTGSGGFAGTFSTGYAGMAEGLHRGFATATTDAGTAPASPLLGDALIGQPRKWRDWARLSTHVMTVTGKAIAQAFYGEAPRRSFYTGCSSGGQQGLIEALYYPADYDGILVAAPVIDRTWGHAAVLWDYAAAHRSEGSLLSDTKLKLLNRSAIAACWKQGKGFAGDAFISDPVGCNFDPGILQCRAASSDLCLTAAEVETARAFYSGPRDTDGHARFFGWLPGSEGAGLFGWSFLQQPIEGQPPFSSLFRWVHGKEWDWRGFEFTGGMDHVVDRLGPIVNDATRGSLEAFAARGGKLIIHHGLADTLVPPEQSIAFYERQMRALGGHEKGAQAARLFLAPGMMHCGGGAGPDSFDPTLGIPAKPTSRDAGYDIFSALIDWTDGGDAPERIIASKLDPEEPGLPSMQRPLCAYPASIAYTGSGSLRSATSFACAPTGAQD